MSLKYFAGAFKALDLTIPEQQELGYMALRDDFERVCSLIFVCTKKMSCNIMHSNYLRTRAQSAT